MMLTPNGCATGPKRRGSPCVTPSKTVRERPNRPNMPDSQPSDLIDPGALRIRNQRYRPWPEIVLAMFVAICLSAMCGLFLVRRLGMFDCLFGGAIVASLALFVFEWLLPRLGSVREIEIGYA